MHNTGRRTACLAIVLAGAAAAAEGDGVAEALSEVRHVKADLFSRTSSVLGKLPGPAELAAHQLRCRPIPKPRAGAPREVRFDAATKRRAAGLDPAALRKAKGRMGMRVLPLGITGAYVSESLGNRELVVVHVPADAPATGALQVDDIIIGANGRLFEDPEDPRPEMGHALVESQSPELGGILTLQIVRDRKPANVRIDLGSTLGYSETWPFDCEKSRQVRQAALKFVMSHYPWHRYDFWTPTFLMASGDEAAMELARRHLCAGLQEEYPEGRGTSTWRGGYRLTNLCEYYLLTGDSAVLPAILHQAQGLAWAQYRSGSWSHGGSDKTLMAPGTATGGYGEINNAGLGALIGLALARECGVEPYDHTLPRAIRFFGKFCGSNFPYGLGTPSGRGGRMDNGMNSMAAIAFRLLGEREMAERWARTACYMWMGRERGHAEAIFSAAWGPLGAALAPPEEFHAFMNQMRWAYEMGRTRDGGLTFMRGSRWTYPNMTAAMGLFLYLPEHRLQILGARRSVFAQRPPKGLERAALYYKTKEWAKLRKFLNDYLKTAEKADPAPTAHLAYARALLAAHDRLERHAAATLKIIAHSIDDGMPATAQLQLDLLARMLGEEREEAARLRERLGEGKLRDRKRPKPEPLVDSKELIKTLGLAKGGVGDGFAHSPDYIGEVNRRGFDGMPPEQIARFLGHFSAGAADGAARALAAHGAEALPLLKRLLRDSHPGLRAGAVATLTYLYKSDSQEYRTEVPDDLAEIIRLLRPMVGDESPLVRDSVGRFVLGVKVLNEDVYDILHEMARRGVDAIGRLVRHGVKDPDARISLCMLLTQSALRRKSTTPANYKPLLVASTAHMDKCRPYVQTAIDVVGSPTVLGLYGFFSNCPRDASMQILAHYAAEPLVLANLPVILDLSFRKGSGKVDVYTIHSVEYPHRIVLKIGPKALPAVDRFLESKRALIERIESGKEDPPAWWQKLRPADFRPCLEQWEVTAELVRCLYGVKPPKEAIPSLCRIYLTGRAWGEWERGRIRDRLTEMGPAALPAVRAALASARAPLLADADKRIAAKQAAVEAADRRAKKPLQKEIDELVGQKVILEQRIGGLEELISLIEHFAAEKPSSTAVEELCRFYTKRTWGSEHPRQPGETSYIRPFYARQLALVRDTLLRWGQAALPAIRRFQEADREVLAEALADLDKQEAFWKTQWARKASGPLAGIAKERDDLPRVRAELEELAGLIEAAAADRPSDAQLAGLCRTYTRHDWPAQKALIRGILKRAQPRSAAVIRKHIRAERDALPEIVSQMNKLMGGTVVPRVRIPYDRWKALAKCIRAGIAELERL